MYYIIPQLWCGPLFSDKTAVGSGAPTTRLGRSWLLTLPVGGGEPHHSHLSHRNGCITSSLPHGPHDPLYQRSLRPYHSRVVTRGFPPVKHGCRPLDFTLLSCVTAVYRHTCGPVIYLYLGSKPDRNGCLTVRRGPTFRYMSAFLTPSITPRL